MVFKGKIVKGVQIATTIELICNPGDPVLHITFKNDAGQTFASFSATDDVADTIQKWASEVIARRGGYSKAESALALAPVAGNA